MLYSSVHVSNMALSVGGTVKTSYHLGLWTRKYVWTRKERGQRNEKMAAALK